MAIEDIKKANITEFTTTGPDRLTWSIDEDGDLKIKQTGTCRFVDSSDLKEFVKLIVSLCNQ